MKTFLLRSWKGATNLWLVFWAVFIPLPILFLVVTERFGVMASSFKSYVVLSVFFGAWLLFAIVSVWRSAITYRAESPSLLAKGSAFISVGIVLLFSAWFTLITFIHFLYHNPHCRALVDDYLTKLIS